PSRFTPDPIQYELRIGVTGHRELSDPRAVDQAVRRLLGQLVDVLSSASAQPHGPHGSPQSGADRFDRGLARCLAWGTRAAGPALEFVTGIGAAALRRVRIVTAPLRPWPRVPVSPDLVPEGRQTPLKLTVISSLA